MANGDITVSVGNVSNDILVSTGSKPTCEKRGLNVNVDEVGAITINGNYNKLKNIPTINSVDVAGNLSLEDLGLRAIYYSTTEGWASTPIPITEEGALYIYSDFIAYTNDHGGNIVVPGIKIGDGKHSLDSLEFINEGSGSGGTTNYNALRNKPGINGVLLEGDKSLDEFGLKAIYAKTKDEWDAEGTETSELGALYIYSDYYSDGEKVVPIIRIGDGESAIGSLPVFAGYREDTANESAYNYLNEIGALVSEDDRANWGKTLKVELDHYDNELIVFSYVG